MSKVFVVAVSGIPGSGKSTLVDSLAKELSPAVTLHFDDYGGTSIYPEDFKAWIASSGDPNDWKTPQLAQDLRSLMSGTDILHPRSGMTVHSEDIIIIEEPFGRARGEINVNIDLAAHINLPLDLAIIRILRRMLAEDAANDETKRQECPIIVETLFQTYLNAGMRELFQYTEQKAAESADIVLDGKQSPEEIKAELIKVLKPNIARPIQQSN